MKKTPIITILSFALFCTFSCNKKSESPTPATQNPENDGIQNVNSRPTKFFIKSSENKWKTGGTFTYNASGKVIKQQTIDSTGAVVPNDYSSYQYNPDGTLAKNVESLSGDITTKTYSYLNGLVNKVEVTSGTVIETYQYYYNGSKLKAATNKRSDSPWIDSLEYVSFNEGGRPLEKTRFRGTSSKSMSETNSIYITYGPNNNLSKVETKYPFSTARLILEEATFSSQAVPYPLNINTFLSTERDPNLDSKEIENTFRSTAKYYSTCANGTNQLSTYDRFTNFIMDSEGRLISLTANSTSNNIDLNCTVTSTSESQHIYTIQY